MWVPQTAVVLVVFPVALEILTAPFIALIIVETGGVRMHSIPSNPGILHWIIHTKGQIGIVIKRRTGFLYVVSKIN